MQTIIEPLRIKSVVPLRPCATLLERLVSHPHCSGRAWHLQQLRRQGCNLVLDAAR